MGDVVLKLPVHEGEEANLFGAFLSRFIESLGAEARAQAANADAPYLMVRSDPQPDVEMKVLIFQQSGAARDFSSGWDKVRGSLAGASAARA
jgi:hypothetical protein